MDVTYIFVETWDANVTNMIAVYLTIYATVRPVCSPPHLGGSVNLYVFNYQVVSVQSLEINRKYYWLQLQEKALYVTG